MTDFDPARIGDVKAGFAAARADTNSRAKKTELEDAVSPLAAKDGSNVEADAFRGAIGAQEELYPNAMAFFASAKPDASRVGTRMASADGLSWDIVAPGAGDFDHPVTGAGIVVVPINGVTTCEQWGITGVGNERERLQLALEKSAGRTFRQLQRIYNDTGGLVPPSGIRWEFGPAAEIELLPHNATTYTMILLIREDQTLVNPRVNGRRDLNSAVTGEHGHGISIRGALNLRVEAPDSRNCWGDSIYVGRFRSSTDAPAWANDLPEPRINQNVTITGAVGDNCRRQGISITCGRHLRIDNPRMSNIAGTAPAAGIDIEPNSALDVLEDIVINNPYLDTTEGQSFICHLGTIQPGPADPEYLVNIQVNGLVGIAAGSAGLGVTKVASNPKITGRVVFNDPMIVRPGRSGIFYEDTFSGARLRVIYNRPVIDGAGANIATPAGSRVCVEAVTNPSSNGQGGALFGPEINNPSLINLANVTALVRVIDAFQAVAGRGDPTGLRFIDPVFIDDVSAMSEPGGRFTRTPGTVFTDRFGVYPTRSISAATTLPYPNDNRDIQMVNGGSTNLTLPSNAPKGSAPYRLRLTTAFTTRLLLQSGGKFLGDTTAGTRISSPTEVGAWIVAKPLGDNVWDVSERSPGWVITTV